MHINFFMYDHNLLSPERRSAIQPLVQTKERKQKTKGQFVGLIFQELCHWHDGWDAEKCFHWFISVPCIPTCPGHRLTSIARTYSQNVVFSSFLSLVLNVKSQMLSSADALCCDVNRTHLYWNTDGAIRHTHFRTFWSLCVCEFL